VEHIADHFVKEKCPDENEVLLAFIKALAGSVPSRLKIQTRRRRDDKKHEHPPPPHFSCV